MTTGDANLFAPPPGAPSAPGESEQDRTERAIVETLDALWRDRDTTEEIDDATIDALLRFGAEVASSAIRLHRQRTPIYRRTPCIDTMVGLARTIEGERRATARPSTAVVGAWQPPRDSPETVERSARIREWATALSEEEYAMLIARGPLHTQQYAARKDLRTTIGGRGILMGLAERVAPTMVPIPLREELQPPAVRKAGGR